MTGAKWRNATPNERTRERIRAAVARRVALIRVLAPDGRCAKCGRTFPHDALQVDHVDGITWNRSSVSPQMRAARYWREHLAGVALRALCGSCNQSDGARHRARHRNTKND